MSESHPKTTHVMENEWWNSLHPGEAEASKSKLSEEELAVIEEWKLQERKMDALHQLDSLAQEYPMDESDKSYEFFTHDPRRAFVLNYQRITDRWNDKYIEDTEYDAALESLALDYIDHFSVEQRERIDNSVARALKSLESVLSDSDEDNRLMSEISTALAELPANYAEEDILPIMGKIYDRVRQDWAEKITPIGDVDKNGKYKLICSARSKPYPIANYNGNYLSCSLLTSEHNVTFEGRVAGFIIDPNAILSAAPYDIYSYNTAIDIRYSGADGSNSGKDDSDGGSVSLPRLDSIAEIEQSEKLIQNVYDEILCPKEAVIGIFYKDGNRELAEAFQRANPSLQIFDIGNTVNKRAAPPIIFETAFDADDWPTFENNATNAASEFKPFVDDHRDDDWNDDDEWE